MNPFSKENLEEITIQVETLALKDTEHNIVFTFEDIAHLDNTTVSRILRKVDNEGLLKALKGTSPALQEKFFDNMSQSLSNQLKEDFEYLGPIPLTVVLEERDKIMKLIEQLIKNDEITIYKGPVV